MLTPTQIRILEVLQDGKPHRSEVLRECLEDDLASLGAIRYHVCMIRKALRPIGQDILCVWHNKRYCYQQVKLLNGAKSLENKGLASVSP